MSLDPGLAPSVDERRAAAIYEVAVLACMDPRVDLPAILGVLGIDPGRTHVIRNAGGVASEDAIRSLVISQRLLGTREIVLVHHTDCGMLRVRDDEVKAQIQAETGIIPPFDLHAFEDVDEDVRRTAQRLATSPFLPHKNIRGYVYDVDSGGLSQIS